MHGLPFHTRFCVKLCTPCVSIAVSVSILTHKNAFKSTILILYDVTIQKCIKEKEFYKKLNLVIHKMMEQKVIHINMNAIKNTHEQNTLVHICPMSSRLSFYDDDVLSLNSYNSDVFSISSYNSDEMNAKFENERYEPRHYHHEEEMSEDEEFDEDEDEDEDEKAREAREKENEKYKKMLDGLSILEGKLKWTETWLEKLETPINPNVDPDMFPSLNDSALDKVGRERKRSKELLKFKPAPHISVVVGNVTSIGLKQPDLPIDARRRQLCRAIVAGKQCSYGDRCIFSHGEKREKPDCRFGNNCKNKKCTFIHPENEPPTPAPASTPTSTPTPTMYKKMWLCKNKFRVTSDKIITLDKCRFGDNCIYAHSKEEVRQAVTECKFGEKCNAVTMKFISKQNNPDMKVRRYFNAENKKICLRLHLKERLNDYITRTTTHS